MQNIDPRILAMITQGRGLLPMAGPQEQPQPQGPNGMMPMGQLPGPPPPPGPNGLLPMAQQPGTAPGMSALAQALRRR